MAFRLSAHNWMRPEPLDVTCKRLHDCGFWGIEIMGEPDLYKPFGETRKTLEKNKIQCWGAVTIMIKCRDLLNADYYLRYGSIQYVKDCISMIHELGGTVLTLVPSEVGKINAMASPEQEWQWAIEGLKPIADHARKEKVRIALEPLNRFETNFLNRHDQALALANEIGDDIGVCLDAFHINIEEKDPLQAIRNVGKRLFDFHIADNNRRAPGDGKWDWGALLKTLKEVGYEGCLTTEFVIPNDRTPCSPRFARKISADTKGSAAEEKFIVDHGGYVMSNEEYSVHFKRTHDHIRAVEPK
ncbi:MAG TPA: sugar phosphate isomerase/epimerase family protein [Planctomycetota bacterium]|nr:sugar phosphate isomerase/epimerase family protein [Planctomycetota bacterium]